MTELIKDVLQLIAEEGLRQDPGVERWVTLRTVAKV